MSCKYSPWAGLRNMVAWRKAAIGKGTLAFPGLQILGLLYHPADKSQEVRKLFYYVWCRRKGVKWGVLPIDADNQWTLLSSPQGDMSMTACSFLRTSWLPDPPQTKPRQAFYSGVASALQIQKTALANLIKVTVY